MGKQNGLELQYAADRDIIEAMKKQLIQTFEALPDGIAAEVFSELHKRGIL